MTSNTRVVVTGSGLAGVRPARVAGVDRSARTERRADGREIAYDTRVPATGSDPVPPPPRGTLGPDHELPEGAHAFRAMHDCRGRSKAPRPAVPAVPADGVPVGEPGTVGALARAGEGAEPLPADGAPPLHPLTNDGGS